MLPWLIDFVFGWGLNLFVGVCSWVGVEPFCWCVFSSGKPFPVRPHPTDARPFGFVLQSPGREWHLCADSKDDLEKILKGIATGQAQAQRAAAAALAAPPRAHNRK